MKNRVLFIAQTGILGAVVIVLSALENVLPQIPPLALPGAKLGISNIVIMCSLCILGLPQALCIAVLKAMMALVMRGPTAFLMCFFGSLLSVIIMYILIKAGRFGFVGIAIGGAAAFNTAQIITAVFLTGSAVFYYLPFMLLFSLLSGFLTGLMLYIVLPYLLKINLFGGAI